RIKDLANIEGVRQNQLVGYGLVVGLNGTGDTLNNAPFTKQSLQAMLERMGVKIAAGAAMRTGNVAAVMVTANLPPFGTQGTRTVPPAPPLGAAKNWVAAPLLATRLPGADANASAGAKASVATNAFRPEGEPPKTARGGPRGGPTPTGPIIKREIVFALNRL